MTAQWKFSTLVVKLSERIRGALGTTRKTSERSLSEEERQLQAEIRGEKSEVRVHEICLGMAVWEQLPPRPSNKLPWRTEQYSTLDLDGVDIVVPTDLGDIHIQVKSSKRYFLKFVQKPGTEDIICVNGTWDEAYLHKRLLDNIWGKYRRLKRLAAT